MHRIEGAPQRVESVVSRSHDFVGITFGVLLQPATPCRAVSFVGLFVHGEISERLRFSDAVESLQSFNFCCGNFGNLGFVGV